MLDIFSRAWSSRPRSSVQRRTIFSQTVELRAIASCYSWQLSRGAVSNTSAIQASITYGNDVKNENFERMMKRWWSNKEQDESFEAIGAQHLELSLQFFRFHTIKLGQEYVRLDAGPVHLVWHERGRAFKTPGLWMDGSSDCLGLTG